MAGEIYCATWWGNDTQYNEFVLRNVIPVPPWSLCGDSAEYGFGVGLNGSSLGYLQSLTMGSISPSTYEGLEIVGFRSNSLNDLVQLEFAAGAQIPTVTKIFVLVSGFGIVELDWVSVDYRNTNANFTTFLADNVGEAIDIIITT